VKAAGIASERCFRKLLTPRTLFLMEMYQHYKNGVLPVAGGLLDQPFAYVHAMGIIDAWFRKV
jgi:hypothetical protein